MRHRSSFVQISSDRYGVSEMMTRAEKNALYEQEAAALYNSMPKRVDGIWCDGCGRKLPPADMLLQYYDAEKRCFRGTCRDCCRKLDEEHARLYGGTYGAVEACRPVPCKVSFELLSHYWTDDDLLELEYVPRFLQSLITERFGSLDNFNTFKMQKEPPREDLNALPL